MNPGLLLYLVPGFLFMIFSNMVQEKIDGHVKVPTRRLSMKIGIVESKTGKVIYTTEVNVTALNY